MMAVRIEVSIYARYLWQYIITDYYIALTAYED